MEIFLPSTVDTAETHLEMTQKLRFLRLSVTSQWWRWNLSGFPVESWSLLAGICYLAGTGTRKGCWKGGARRAEKGSSWVQVGRGDPRICALISYNCDRGPIPMWEWNQWMCGKDWWKDWGLVYINELKKNNCFHRLLHDNQSLQRLLSGWCSRLCGLQPPSCLRIWGEPCVAPRKPKWNYGTRISNKFDLVLGHTRTFVYSDSVFF